VRSYDTDVVVVGAGAIGSSCAYYLSKAGLQVTLLDAAGPLGSGATTGSLGAINMLTKKPGPYLRLALSSSEMFTFLADELGAEFEYERRGGLLVAQTRQEAEYLEYLVGQQQSAGVPAEFWTASQARQREPWLAGHLLCASYTPTEGLVNPLLLVTAFRQAALRLGARVSFRRPVTNIWKQAGIIAGVETDDGKIRCRAVVNAAGVASPAIGRMAGLDHPVVPVRGQVLITEPIPRPIKGIVMSAGYVLAKHRPDLAPENDPLGVGLVCRPTACGSLMIGVTQERGLAGPETTLPGLGAIARHAYKVLPSLSRVTVMRAFSGARPSSETGFPIIRQCREVSGYVVASGHAGDGVALSPITGQRVADLVTGRSSIDPAIARIIEDLGALAVPAKV
jgi:glycine/D-amino acid oxidase-like deaminating enzyme